MKSHIWEKHNPIMCFIYLYTVWIRMVFSGSLAYGAQLLDIFAVTQE